MRKVSVIGIDCTGKTSVVRSLGKAYNAPIIHLTKYKNSLSRVAKLSSGLVNGLARFGERRDLKLATGAAYFAHLFPYKFEEMANVNSDLLISDRDPIIDTLCYSDFYLPSSISKTTAPLLKFFLEQSFNYPTSFIYLDISPEKSMERNHGENQLHEKVDALSRLKDLFDEQMFFLNKKGIPINRIDTTSKSLDEVIGEAKFLLK